MDLTTTIAPKSDQLNADDLIAAPMTVTIANVSQGNAEQPVNVNLVEFPGRAYRPSKSMRRILVSGWGAEASTYTGRRLTLYRNPEITFGRDKVGGIEISAMSHIDSALTVALTTTRGKRKNFTVQPLATEPAIDWVAKFNKAPTLPELVQLWEQAGVAGARSPEVIAAKDKRKGELNAQ